MNKALKDLGEVLLLLILNIAIAPLRALAVLLLASMFNLEFITQFSFVQVLGIICVFKLISINVNSEGLKKDENTDRWKDLGLKVLHIALSIVIAYMFLCIFK